MSNLSLGNNVFAAFAENLQQTYKISIRLPTILATEKDDGARFLENFMVPNTSARPAQ
jgi:hypothetical protein